MARQKMKPRIEIAGRTFLSQRAAAEKLGTCEATLANRRKNGELPHHLLGSKIYYSEEDLLGAITPAA